MFKNLLLTTGKAATATLSLAALLAGHAAQAQTTPTVDGTLDAASYGTVLATQTNFTGFGDSSVGLVGGANGDELDNVYARIFGSNLYLFIGGNLQSNNNHLEIFFDSKKGGQNQLTTGNGSLLDSLSGIKFDAGFTADYLLSVSVKGTSTGGTTPTASFASITVNYGVVGGGGGTAGIGKTAGASQPLTFGSDAGAVAINNSNTKGVSGDAKNPNIAGAATVTTGLELMIPLSALGTTAGGGDMRIAAFTNGAKHDYVANQALGGFPLGTANLGDGTGAYTGGATPVSKVDFTAFAGNQYVTVSNTALATAAAAGLTRLSVAPNPSHGSFVVQLPASAGATQLALYNSLGQVVRQQSAAAGAPSATVETGGLATGVYVLRARSSEQVIGTQRVVVQ